MIWHSCDTSDVILYFCHSPKASEPVADYQVETDHHQEEQQGGLQKSVEKWEWILYFFSRERYLSREETQMDDKHIRVHSAYLQMIKNV